MNIFNNNSDDYTKDAIEAEQNAFNQAAGYMNPFTQYAGTDFDSARNALLSALGIRKQPKGYNQNFFQILGQSPTDMLNQAMASYSMSPAAQQEEKYAMSALDNSMTAAGMGGSGDNMLAAGEIGNDIYEQDMSNYLGSLMKSFGVQRDVLGMYNKQNDYLIGLLQDMLGVENKASQTMAGDSMKEGQVIANADTREAANNRYKDPFKEMLSLLGAGIGGYEDYNTNKMLSKLL